MKRNRIIAALDVDSPDKAVAVVDKLQGHVEAFKVGLELFNHSGREIFDMLRAAGAEKIFYDCKFHDIPNTVASASRAAAQMGVWMFNVHCSGGSAMMAAAAKTAREQAATLQIAPPLVIGVTVLTSLDQEMVETELGVGLPIADLVVQLAKLAKNAGLDGVVASPLEIEAIRAACGPDFLIITPGVRPVAADIGDQKRVLTPAEAVRCGADYLVIGRPIVKADDPAAAADAIAGEIESALN